MRAEITKRIVRKIRIIKTEKKNAENIYSSSPGV
jgi:hypothetical protein